MECSEADIDVVQDAKSTTLEIAFPDTEGKLIALKSGVIIEEKEGYFILDGDILLTDDQIELLSETGSIFPEEVEPIDSANIILIENPAAGVEYILNPDIMQTRAVGRHPYEGMIWSMVRYVLDPTLDYYTQMNIQAAIEHYNVNTNVRFYNATNKPKVDPTYGFEYPYVYFTHGTGSNRGKANSSYVGRKGGKQELLLQYYAAKGTIIHEIGHAIGLYHEQSRYDRDNFVTVHYSNVSSGHSHNFSKQTRNYYITGSFDWNSIMLYSSYDFSSNGKPTMTKKDGTTFTGQRSYLSEMDRRWANTFYLPYVERDDICLQLDKTVYKSNNSVMTDSERRNVMYQINQNRGNCYYQVPNW